MSYDKVIEYKIIPTEPFKIIRGCPGCKSKQIFSCREHFRVNANGSRLDVWLIYGCEKCGHTYNLPIFERVNPAKISRQEYLKFLSNDKSKVFEIGTEKAVFRNNKAELSWDEAMYKMEPRFGDEANLICEGTVLIQLYNPYDIPVRADKAASEILHILRSEAKKWMRSKRLSVEFVGKTQDKD